MGCHFKRYLPCLHILFYCMGLFNSPFDPVEFFPPSPTQASESAEQISYEERAVG